MKMADMTGFAVLKEAYRYPDCYLEPTEDGMWFDKSIHGVIER